MYFLKPSYVLHSNFMSSLNVYVDLKQNILLVSFSIFISLLFTFMRVTIWIRSYFSSCFIFCERKTSFGFCEFCLILCWFFSGREMMTWYHWDRKPCSWSRPGRWVCLCVSCDQFCGCPQSVMISHWKYQTPYSHKQIFVQYCSFLLQPSLMEFFISKQWINKFNTFAEPGPISNDDFLCKHGGNLSICFC